MSEVRVLIVDDHAILRDGIRSMLERYDDIQLVGEAGDGRQALALVAALKPDIVLMDINMPEMNGLEATRLIVEQHPQTKVLILTQHDNHEYVTSLLQAGAAGYVLKRSGGRDLINAIHQVHDQGAYLEGSVARQLLDRYTSRPASDRDGLLALTERERQVLHLIAQGKSNKEIAQRLVISPKTVSVHRTNIMNKLNVESSFELIRYVTQNQILDENDRTSLPESQPPAA
ncbi:MAG TPA: response regulator transcription factor [Anaerolineales bacterium]|nr:response regulator transcription factor [Anaerolineales bacterium]